MTVLRNRGRWGTSNATYARGRVAAYDKRTPAGRGGVDRLRPARPFAPTRWPVATSRTWPTPSTRSPPRGLVAAYPVRRRFYEIGTPRPAETERFLRGGARRAERRSARHHPKVLEPDHQRRGSPAGSPERPAGCRRWHRRRRPGRQVEREGHGRLGIGRQADALAVRPPPDRIGVRGRPGSRTVMRSWPGGPIALRLDTTSSTGPDVQAKIRRASSSGGYQRGRRWSRRARGRRQRVRAVRPDAPVARRQPAGGRVASTCVQGGPGSNRADPRSEVGPVVPSPTAV